MTPRPPAIPEQRRRELAQAQVEELKARLEATDRRLLRIQNTMKAVARTAGVSVAGPCSRCDQSYLLVTEGTIACPHCGYHRCL